MSLFNSLRGRLGKNAAWVTYTLALSCVIMYLLCLVFPGLTMKLYFMPALGMSEPWRFFTAAFLHDIPSPVHLICNMWALLIVGPALERLLGRLRFAYLYLVSAFGGTVGTLLACQVAAWMRLPETIYFWVTACVGASGAVFGLFGALLSMFRQLRLPRGQIAALIVVNMVLGFIIPGIAWEAHLGGLLVGAALGACFGREILWRRNKVVVTGELGDATVQTYSMPSYSLKHLGCALSVLVVLLGVVIAMYAYYAQLVNALLGGLQMYDLG